MPTVPALDAPSAAPATDRRSRATTLVAALVVLLSATTVVLAGVDSRRGRDYQLHTLLIESDLALLALVVLAVGGVRAALRSWRRHACTLGAGLVGLALVPAFLAHPSDRGVAALLRWAGAVALGLAVAGARHSGRRLLTGAVAAVIVAHLAVAFAQRAHGGPIGLGAVGEGGAYEIGGRYASSGLTVHPYLLAAWCAVAGTVLLALRGRPGSTRLGAVVGVVAFAGIGLTLSRAGLLAAGLALAALGWAALRGRDRSAVAHLLGAAAALVAGIMASLSGWLARAGQTTVDADAVSSGRVALLRQAWGLLRESLLTGVGPGRYVLALVEEPALVALSPQGPRPVHLTPLLLVVEGGLLVVPALVLLVLAVGRACRRGGAPASAVTLAMVPFLALDHLAWSYPQGIVLTGLWLGVLDLLSGDLDGGLGGGGQHRRPALRRQRRGADRPDPAEASPVRRAERQAVPLSGPPPAPG